MAGRSLAKLDAALAELSSSSSIVGKLSTLHLDVTDDASIASAAETVTRQFGRLDVLVHNAAVGGLNMSTPTPAPAAAAASVAAATRAEFQLVLDTNVTGPAVVAAAFRPLLLKSANPYSVYVSSGARTLMRNAMQKTREHVNIKSAGAYQVSKAALNMLAVMEARDFGDVSGEVEAGEGNEGGSRHHGIKVFAMSPGFVKSNLRGTSEEARSGWGKAGDPEESGRLLLSIVRGERDSDVGCLVHKDGVFGW